MANALTLPDDTGGPAMQACTALERAFVTAYLEHPTYSNTALAQEAAKAVGNDPYPTSSERTAGHRLSRSERVLAAIQEEGGKRLRMGGVIGVNTMIKIAQDATHKDQLKAAGMLADRTGFHATTEHKVIVDDKRPQTRQEMVAKIRQLGKEAGWSEAMIAQAVDEEAPPLNVIDAEFTEVVNFVEQEDL